MQLPLHCHSWPSVSPVVIDFDHGSTISLRTEFQRYRTINNRVIDDFTTFSGHFFKGWANFRIVLRAEWGKLGNGHSAVATVETGIAVWWHFDVSQDLATPGPKFTDDIRTILRQFADLRQSYDNWRIHRTFMTISRPIFRQHLTILRQLCPIWIHRLDYCLEIYPKVCYKFILRCHNFCRKMILRHILR